MNVARIEGNLLATYGREGSGEKSLEECQEICKRTTGCHSIGFCPRDKCYLYDKIIIKGEPEKINTDCFTSYLSCSRNDDLFLSESLIYIS